MIELRGSFTSEDLYLAVGREQFVCTFAFRDGSDAQKALGREVTGTIAYSPKQRDALEHSQPIEGESMLRIHLLNPELSRRVTDDLKYDGVAISDVEAVSYMPYKTKGEMHEDGAKKVPGILYVDLEHAEAIDIDVLFKNFMIQKNNDGVALIPHERERLIGTMLGLNEGRINGRILNHFGFKAETASNNNEINYYRLMTIKRRSSLTSKQAERLAVLQLLRSMRRVQCLIAEVKRSGLTDRRFVEHRQQLEAISESIKDFEPHVLLNGKTQIYWDLEGYLHVALRHVKEMQVGSFQRKTPFPYRHEELKVLVEQVLAQIKQEIREHFDRPANNSPFTRHGRMAVYFNDDYYHLRIDPTGRLESFHVVGPPDP